VAFEAGGLSRPLSSEMRLKLTSPTHVRSLLEALGMSPSAAAGQNFLVDSNILRILIDAADIRPLEPVLEIGPGLGTVTEALLAKGARVTAVERDRRLCEHLRERFAGAAGLDLRPGDFLELGADALEALAPAKVVSNLPYSSGSRMLVDLCRMRVPPALMVVTVQLEVAERLAAHPGSRDYGLLSVWVQLRYDVALEKKVSPTCFYPAPKVWSAIVRMARKARPDCGLRDESLFYDLTREAFTYRRKQLATILSRAEGRLSVPTERGQALLRSVEADAKARPEDLSVAQWCALSNALADPTR
jgi:16S rRNA (adenine1518-N6/adenine1519-N6)-dimethyltransferase